MPPSIRSLPQVCLLFLLASLVSIGVIYLLNAEVDAMKRKQANAGDDKEIMEQDIKAPPPPHHLLHTFSTSITSQLTTFYTNFKHGLEKLRSKRSLADDHHHHRLRHEIKNKKTKEKPPVILTPIIERQDECYGTDNVLIVVAITCLLNFSFVFVVWASVRWVNRAAVTSGRSRKDNWKRFTKKKKEKVGCCWEEEVMSDDDTEEESEEEDNQIVKKSYSMEDLRFYC